MTEPNSNDHWAALAGDLGAEPVPEKPQPTPATTEDPSAEGQQPFAAALPIFKPVAKSVVPRNVRTTPRGVGPTGRGIWYRVRPQPVVSEPPASRAFGFERASPSSPRSEGQGYRSVSTGFSEEIKTRIPSPPAHLPASDENLAPAEIAAEIEAELTAWDDLDPTATEPRAFKPQEALDVMDENGRRV